VPGFQAYWPYLMVCEPWLDLGQIKGIGGINEIYCDFENEHLISIEEGVLRKIEEFYFPRRMHSDIAEILLVLPKYFLLNKYLIELLDRNLDEDVFLIGKKLMEHPAPRGKLLFELFFKKYKGVFQKLTHAGSNAQIPPTE
jgi:hypothetical protein